MHFRFKNVNDAFVGLVQGIHSGNIPTERTSSRNGDVLYIQEPVIVTYENPMQRVLFNLARDANPFFHLYESLWMLAGSNQLAPLTYYLPGYANFSDDGETVNGAYGYRWRHALWDNPLYDEQVDQLKILIEHLQAKPDSRRAVLQMWNVEDDLLKIGSTCPRCGGPGCYVCEKKDCKEDGSNQYPGIGNYNQSKDVCCNLCVMFSIRTEQTNFCSTLGSPYTSWLDMTVINRSNDLILGMLGANVVHFAYLQQYVADCLKIQMGVYNQVSNNLHVYLSNWEPEKWLASKDCGEYPYRPFGVPLVENQETFDNEVRHFVDRYSGREGVTQHGTYKEPYLFKVATPMMEAFKAHKERNYEAALSYIQLVQAPDWQLAGEAWIRKRRDNWLAKQKEQSDAQVKTRD